MRNDNRREWTAYRKEVFAKLTAQDVYRRIEAQRSSGGRWVKGKCPWHEDEHPSFGFHRESLRWKCHAGCGEGSAFDYLMKVSGRGFRDVVLEQGDKLGIPRPSGVKLRERRPPISEHRVKQWQEALWQNKQALSWLREKRGLRDETFERYQIGWDATRQRYTVPVRDEGGRVVNVRLYSPTKDPKVLNYTDGKHRYGSPPRLYGLDQLVKHGGKQVVICEGEWDRLLLQQEGFVTVTSTHGCRVFPHEWGRWFQRKDVVILYDCDEQGKRAAEETVLTVLRGAKCPSIRNVVLPLKGTPEDKDVTDFLVGHGFSGEKLSELVAATPTLAPEEQNETTAIEKLRTRAAEEKTLLPVDVAGAYLEQRGYKKDGMLKLLYWKGDWWKWDGRKYVEIPPKEFEAQIMGFLARNDITRSKSNTRFARDVAANLQGTCLLEGEAEQPSWLLASGPKPARDCISMENGVLDLNALLDNDTNCLKPHTPAFFTCVSLPYPFDAKAECPRWLSFLEHVLPDSQVRELVREWFGYCLTYDTSLHRFLILEGEGRNGKSVVCDIMRALLGEENVSAVPLEAFTERFGLSPTRGKLANVAEEVGDLDKVAEGVLKTFVGGGAITMDRKFRDAVTVRATARLVFATNTRPRIRDRSKGIWERLILVPFKVEIPAEKREPDLAKEFLGELPGIFNWAFAGRVKLRERRRFVEPRVCMEAKEDYRSETNPARVFLLERCEVDEGLEIATTDLYSEYKHYCHQNGYSPLGQAQFGKEVSRLFRELTGHDGPKTTRPWVNGVRCQKYQGIGFEREKTAFGQGGQGKPYFIHNRQMGSEIKEIE